MMAARLGASSWAFAIMAASFSPAERMRGAMRRASGRFFQYLTGISRFMASTCKRAGLKMFA